MTTYVVCLDGTDQRKDQRCPTNIARIFDALGGHPGDAGNGSLETAAGAVFGKYLPGVGALGSPVLRIVGNLFGDGIAELIVRGYTFLSRSYAKGDRIVIVGFSRGATAARALAGLVVARGMLNRGNYDPADKEQAYKRAIAAWYRYRSGKPDLANQARLHLIERLIGGGLPQLTDADFTGPADIAAIGVFDTVSSLGLPHLDAGGSTIFDFSICDTVLNDRVAAGFHALAADEARELFTPTFWASRAGVVQHIFPGGHSDVGGGYAEHGLADCALQWMIAQLNSVEHGLLRTPAGFDPKPGDAAHDESRKFPFLLTPARARSFPKEALPSETLRARVAKTCTTIPGFSTAAYRPRGRYADGTAIV